MSREELHAIANRDTPQEVVVPNTIAGLLLWAAGRWGVGVIVAAVALIGTAKVYEDMSELNDRVIVAFERMAAVQAENAAAIRELTKAVETQVEVKRRIAEDR
jgi:hypothetical protein